MTRSNLHLLDPQLDLLLEGTPKEAYVLPPKRSELE